MMLLRSLSSGLQDNKLIVMLKLINKYHEYRKQERFGVCVVIVVAL